LFNRRAELHTLGAQISASDWPGARATAAGLATHAHNANRLPPALPSGGEPLKPEGDAVDEVGDQAPRDCRRSPPSDEFAEAPLPIQNPAN